MDIGILALLISGALGVLGVLFDFRRKPDRRLTFAGWAAICLIAASAALSMWTSLEDDRTAQAREEDLRRALAAEEVRDRTAMAERDQLQSELTSARAALADLQQQLDASEQSRTVLLQRSAEIDFELFAYFHPEGIRERAQANPWIQDVGAQMQAFRDDGGDSALGRRCYDAAQPPEYCYEIRDGQELVVDWQSPVWRAWRRDHGENVWLPPSFELYTTDIQNVTEDLREELEAEMTSRYGGDCFRPSPRREPGFTQIGRYQFVARADRATPPAGTGMIIDIRDGLPIGFSYRIRTSNMSALDDLGGKSLIFNMSTDMTYESRRIALRARTDSFIKADFRMPRAIELVARFVDGADITGFNVRWLPVWPEQNRPEDVLEFKGPRDWDGMAGHVGHCLFVFADIPH